MARRQIAHGASGLTVAKIGEADAMLQATNDILIAYPALDAYRSHRLAELAKKNTIRVAIDSAFAADAISAAAKVNGVTIGVLVDLDVGFHRTGVQDAEAAVALATHIASRPGLRYDGLFFFPGHLKSAADPNAHQAAMTQISTFVRQAKEAIAAAGLETKIVSGGSTPSGFQSHFIPEASDSRFAPAHTSTTIGTKPPPAW